MMKTVAVALAMAVIGLASAASARADEFNKQTILTFSQPVEIPGQVLPPGTYMFKLADTMSDRHIVQIFTADGSRIIATVMAIPDYRLTTTDQTVITFNEVPKGAPEAIRAWFYPGNSIGQEFVYPKSRATQLAKTANAVVPALSVDVADVAELKTAPIVAITPEAKEVPVTAAIQTSPRENVASNARVSDGSSTLVGTTGIRQTGQSARTTTRHLPKTASALPLIALLGFSAIAIAVGFMVFGKRAIASAA